MESKTYTQWNTTVDVAGGRVFQLPGNVTILASHLDQDLIVKVGGVRYINGQGIRVSTSSGNDLIVSEICIDGVIAGNPTISISVTDWVYFSRQTAQDPWYPIDGTNEIKVLWSIDASNNDTQDKYKREHGRYPLNFAWFHRTEQFHLIDPAPSNIIDIFVIPVGYYNEVTRWLDNRIDNPPVAPTPLQLRSDYAKMLDNAMISDTVVLHPGKFKILFGPRAPAELQCYFSVIRPVSTSLTDNEVKVRIVSIIRTFFDINSWEFGETFFATELSASIHANLGPEIDSVVLVPTYASNYFGDLFQVLSREDEFFTPDVNTSLIEIVQSYTPSNIRQR
jgi:hypothetical protein